MSEPQPAQVHVEVADGVGWLTLDNPARLNAISLPMWQTIGEALKRFEADDALRCVVLRGQGDKAFCAGGDISQFEKLRSSAESSAEYDRVTSSTQTQIQTFPKPTIAMISGFCLGGGLALAMMCDLRIAAAGSVFGIPAARLSIAYSFQGLKRLSELVGPAQAKRILFLGDRYPAEEALRIGLVDELHAAGELEARVRAMTARIASNAPLSIAASKVGIDVLCGDDLAAAQAAYAPRQRACMASQDYVEGRRAFMDKRQPAFKGH